MQIQSNTNIQEALSSLMDQDALLQGALTSFVAITVLLILRYVLIRAIRGKKEILAKEQRSWINRINNTVSVMILICLVFIWAPQLHTFALSLTALAVAIVLTTKELLMCLTGGFLRASAKPFRVGDWISLDGVSGEVMKISAATTQLEKIDTEFKSFEFTGESIQIPNSRFLSANISNISFLKSYRYNDITMNIDYAELNPAELMKTLKDIVEEHYEPYQKKAAEFNRRIERKTGVDFADTKPQFYMHTTDISHCTFGVRIFVPTHEARNIESLIVQDFLEDIYDLRQKKETTPECDKDDAATLAAQKDQVAAKSEDKK